MSRSNVPAAAVTAGATFLAFLDVTVVNLAFPDLRREFPAASLTDVAWVITAYAVAFAAFLAPGGRLADVVGRRRLFLLGVLAFAVSSAVAAAAPSLAVLVAARAVQGAAAAAMIPSSLALLLMHSPAERRTAAIGLWGASGSVAAALGPALGGVLVAGFGWRSVFLINVPLAAAILVAARRLPKDAPRAGRLPDPVGTVAVTAGVALLVLAISQGPEWGWLVGRTATAAVLGAALLAGAVVRSRGHAAPAMPVDLWRIRPYATANAVSALFGAALFAWMLLGVVFLVQVWGYSELRAGLAMSPGALGAAVTSLAAGRLVGRLGQRRVVAIGGVGFAAAVLVFAAAAGPEPAFLSLWLPVGLAGGAAVGMVGTSLSSAAAVSVPPVHFASAVGLTMTARQFGGAVGIAGLAALLQTRAGDGVEAFTLAYVGCAAVMLAGVAMSSGLPRAAPEKVPEPEVAVASAARH